MATPDFDAVTDRRKNLALKPNPRPGLDYLIAIKSEIALIGEIGNVSVKILFVPDKDILPPPDAHTYFQTLECLSWMTLEDLGQALLSDLNSELVPRWIWVRLKSRFLDIHHSVSLEDRQPHWKNNNLLTRLGKI